MAKEQVTVTFSVDRQALNSALGNTSKPTSREALKEALESLASDGLYYGCGCGCNCWEPDPLPISFHMHSD